MFVFATMASLQVSALRAEEEVESLADVPSGSRCVPPKLLSECLLAVASPDRVDDFDAQRIARETLIDAHHPCISTWPVSLAGLVRSFFVHSFVRSFVVCRFESASELYMYEASELHVMWFKVLT